MNKFIYGFIFVFAVGSMWSCQKSGHDESKAKEEEQRKQMAKMGGLGMPRGLINKTVEATPGYVLFCPLLSATTYLVNLDGEVVHTWESQYGPSGFSYLKENGNLLRGGRDPQAPVFAGGGQGGRLQEITWEGELVWDYQFASEQHLSHHDATHMPNGNILALAWEAKTPEEARKAGLKPALTPKAGVWPDIIVELQPEGKNNAKIIWEWHSWDHLIQDFDQSQNNFGVVTEHPELIDLNKKHPLPPPTTQEAIDKLKASNQASTNSSIENEGSDIFHTNAIAYNADLDQIVVSMPGLDEILIIDHSTTIQEASTHKGGRWGNGGDFLYRWGNPKNYNRGDTTNHMLGGQHDVKWIPKGYPGEGNIMVFDNSVPNQPKPYSAVLEITTPHSEKSYSLEAGKPFGPGEAIWKYLANDTTSFFSPFISGAHRMANGNTFITEGVKGRYFEVTLAGKVVWEYWTPYAGFSRMPDGTFPQPVGPLIYATFRATHIMADHPSVKGKTLEPLSPQPEVYKVEKPSEGKKP